MAHLHGSASGTVADRQEVDLVRRTVAEFTAALGRRERLFREAGVTSVEAFRMRRAAGEFADEQATDLMLDVAGTSTTSRVRDRRNPVTQSDTSTPPAPAVTSPTRARTTTRLRRPSTTSAARAA